MDEVLGQVEENTNPFNRPKYLVIIYIIIIIVDSISIYSIHYYI